MRKSNPPNDVNFHSLFSFPVSPLLFEDKQQSTPVSNYVSQPAHHAMGLVVITLG